MKIGSWVLLLTLTVLTAPAAALSAETRDPVAKAWQGRWQGFVSLSFSDDDDPRNCGRQLFLIKTEITGDRTQLVLPLGLPDCGHPSEFNPGTRLEIKGSALFFSGKSIGSISSNRIHLLSYSDSGYKEFIELTRMPGELHYRKAFSLIGGKRDFVIEASLGEN